MRVLHKTKSLPHTCHSQPMQRVGLCASLPMLPATSWAKALSSSASPACPSLVRPACDAGKQRSSLKTAGVSTMRPQQVARRAAASLANPAAAARASVVPKAAIQLAEPQVVHTSSQPTLNSVSTEITKRNFHELLPVVRAALAECQFFSFDCEMTGLFPEGQQDHFLDDYEDRYRKAVDSSQQFLVNQFGLSAFSWRDGAYEAKTFNFYLFPQPHEDYDRRFLCQASSLAFLASQGFDFNKFISEGVPFMPLQWRDRKLQELDHAKSELACFEPSSPEHDALVEDIVQSVGEWLQTESPTYHLPPVSTHLRGVQHYALRSSTFNTPQAPRFYVEAADSLNGRVLVLQRASPPQVAAHREKQRAARREELSAAAGFSVVLEAMRDCGKPAVGHNIHLDLTFTLMLFVKQLPKRWEDYKQLVACWFPGGVYDTKYIARQLGDDALSETALGPLYAALYPQDPSRPCSATKLLQRTTKGPDGMPWRPPQVAHAPGFTQYCGADAAAGKAHEAGYDAFMTGSIFASLLRLHEAKLARQGAAPCSPPSIAPVAQFMGRQHVMRSDLPYAALQEEDPVPSRPSVFHVSAPWLLRRADVQAKFAEAGCSKIRMQWLTSASARRSEVLVDMQDPAGAWKVLINLKKVAWNVNVQAYRDFYLAKRQQAAVGDEGGSRGGGSGIGQGGRGQQAEAPAAARGGYLPASRQGRPLHRRGMRSSVEADRVAGSSSSEDTAGKGGAAAARARGSGPGGDERLPASGSGRSIPGPPAATSNKGGGGPGGTSSNASAAESPSGAGTLGADGSRNGQSAGPSGRRNAWSQGGPTSLRRQKREDTPEGAGDDGGAVAVSADDSSGNRSRQVGSDRRAQQRPVLPRPESELGVPTLTLMPGPVTDAKGA